MLAEVVYVFKYRIFLFSLTKFKFGKYPDKPNSFHAALEFLLLLNRMGAFNWL